MRPACIVSGVLLMLFYSFNFTVPVLLYNKTGFTVELQAQVSISVLKSSREKRRLNGVAALASDKKAGSLKCTLNLFIFPLKSQKR